LVKATYGQPRAQTRVPFDIGYQNSGPSRGTFILRLMMNAKRIERTVAAMIAVRAISFPDIHPL
jgi:hypothetical protein